MFSKQNLSVNQWIIVFIILAIPFVNLIFLLIWALSSDENPNIKNFSRAIFKLNLIIIGIFIAIIIGLGGNLPSSILDGPVNDQNALQTLFSTNQSKTEAQIKFDKVVYRTQMGITVISGETINHDIKEHSFSFIVTFYDKDKNIIGTGTGIVNNIGAGQTKTFEAITQDSIENAANYKIDIDTMLY